MVTWGSSSLSSYPWYIPWHRIITCVHPKFDSEVVNCLRPNMLCNIWCIYIIIYKYIRSYIHRYLHVCFNHIMYHVSQLQHATSQLPWRTCSLFPDAPRPASVVPDLNCCSINIATRSATLAEPKSLMATESFTCSFPFGATDGRWDVCNVYLYIYIYIIYAM